MRILQNRLAENSVASKPLLRNSLLFLQIKLYLADP